MRRDRLPTARAGEPMGPAREGSIDGVFPWSHGNGVRFIESTLIPGERRIGAEEGRVRGRDTFGSGTWVRLLWGNKGSPQENRKIGPTAVARVRARVRP